MSAEPKDFYCMSDFEPSLRLGTRQELYRMQAFHRVTTDSVFGPTDDHVNFGVDLRTKLGGTDFDIESAVEDAVTKDTWVRGADITVTRTLSGNEKIGALVDIRLDTTAGPVDLFISVTELTIELLEGA